MISATTESITVRVLLFSVLRERLGTPELELTLDARSNTDALLTSIADRHPDVQAFLPVLRVAVNQEYVGGAVDLKDGDEVALITPVSGG